MRKVLQVPVSEVSTLYAVITTAAAMLSGRHQQEKKDVSLVNYVKQYVLHRLLPLKPNLVRMGVEEQHVMI